MKLTVAKLVLSVVSAVGLMPSAFGADTFTTSKAGDFDLGQRLVTCAAFYDFAAELTASLNKPAATERFRDLSRGWTLAGMLLLSSGATQPKFDARQTADAIRTARLTMLKARAEMGGAEALDELQADHKRDCDPLTPTQENIITVLRQGSTAQPPRKR